MRASRIVVLLFAVLIVAAGGAGLYLLNSIKNDMAEMERETPAIFIVNPDTGEVEIGFAANRATGEVLLIDSEQKVDGKRLAEIFAGDEEGGSERVIGTLVKGYTYSEGSLLRQNIRVDRIILVDDTVVVGIFSMVEPQKVTLGEKGGVFYAESMVDSTTLRSVLRGDFDALVWKVEFTAPVLNRPVVRTATTGELLKLAEGFGIEASQDIVRAVVLAQIGGKVAPLFQDAGTRMELLRTLLQEYRAERIRTYPENTLTKVIKLIPEEQILNQLEGRL